MEEGARRERLGGQFAQTGTPAFIFLDRKSGIVKEKCPAH